MNNEKMSKVDMGIMAGVIAMMVLGGCYFAYGDIFRQWLTTFSTISLIFVGSALSLVIANLGIITLKRLFEVAMGLWAGWEGLKRGRIDTDYRRAEVLELHAKTRLIDSEAVAKQTIVLGLSATKGALIVHNGNPTYIPPILPTVGSQPQLTDGMAGEVLGHDVWFSKALKANHLILLGESGSGKSTMARAFIGQTVGKVVAIDPHGRRKEWQCEIVGAGRNFDQIDGYFNAVLKEMDKRYKAYDVGLDTFEPLTVVVDEVTTLAKKCKNWANFFTELATEGRKVGIRLMILIHGKGVKTLKLEGEGDLRHNLTFVYLGKHAVAQNKAAGDMARPAVMEVDGVNRLIDVSHLANIGTPANPFTVGFGSENEVNDKVNGSEGEGEVNGSVNDHSSEFEGEVLADLSNDRQRIIAQLLLAGMTDAAIAKHLGGKFDKNKGEVLEVRSILNGHLAHVG